ncbi:MAG: hypothetical protein AMXMBFR81_12870 [Chthonomonas sp.]
MSTRNLACFAALSIASLAKAGDVAGTVTLNGKAVANVAVTLEGPGTSRALNRRMDQRERTFVPHVMVVPVGSSVTFPNSDTLHHNVYFTFNEKVVDLGTYARGQSKTYKFDKPGLARMLCRIHSEMSAFILVVETNHYDVSAKNGTYKIEKVPPGTYTLKAWHESGAVATHKVEVPATGVLKLDLEVRKR